MTLHPKAFIKQLLRIRIFSYRTSESSPQRRKYHPIASPNSNFLNGNKITFKSCIFQSRIQSRVTHCLSLLDCFKTWTLCLFFCCFVVPGIDFLKIALWIHSSHTLFFTLVFKSMLFSISTEQCNHHHNQFQNISVSPPKKHQTY